MPDKDRYCHHNTKIFRSEEIRRGVLLASDVKPVNQKTTFLSLHWMVLFTSLFLFFILLCLNLNFPDLLREKLKCLWHFQMAADIVALLSTNRERNGDKKSLPYDGQIKIEKSALNRFFSYNNNWRGGKKSRYGPFLPDKTKNFKIRMSYLYQFELSINL